MQTSVTSFLDREGVDYRLLPHTKPVRTIEEAALERGVNPAQMVKSILLRDMGGFHVLACVPGPAQVDPRKVRAMFGCRRMTCADARDVEKVTGLVIGTVAPVGLKQPLPIIFDHASGSTGRSISAAVIAWRGSSSRPRICCYCATRCLPTSVADTGERQS